MNVDLHIEELILHGFTPGDRHHIAQAIERELTRLFTEEGVPPSLAQGGDVAHLDGGSFDVAPGPDTGAIGAQVAQAVFGRLAT